MAVWTEHLGGFDCLRFKIGLYGRNFVNVLGNLLDVLHLLLRNAIVVIDDILEAFGAHSPLMRLVYAVLDFLNGSLGGKVVHRYVDSVSHSCSMSLLPLAL